MRLDLEFGGIKYSCDTQKVFDISIPLMEWPQQPNAYFAPPFEASPVRDGDFIGALEKGSPVNYYNIRLNPHGNGTHTECLSHIESVDWSIRRALMNSLIVADLVSVYPEKQENGDRAIQIHSLTPLAGDEAFGEALIVRTLPNPEEKKYAKYSGNNPPYFALDSIKWIHSRGYRHLLTDLPSVDPEKDGGRLAAHKKFWDPEDDRRFQRTITEMIFVDNEIPDGKYLLDLQILNIELDASPSRPMLYPLSRR